MGGSLRRVLASWLLCSSAHWMFMVAAGVAAFAEAGAGAVGIVAVARLVPALAAAPIAGWLIDRLDRPRLVVVSCALSALALSAGSFTIAHGLALGWLVAAIVAESLLGAPLRPALESLLPPLSREPADLVRATAWWSAVDSGGFLVGAGLGGVLLALTSAATTVGLAAGLAAGTAILAAGLPRMVACEPLPDEQDAGALAGIRVVIATPALHAPFVLLAGLLVLEGATDVQLVALAIGRLDLGSGGPGLLYSVWGVGGVLGSVVLLRIVRRTGYGRALAVGALLFGILLAIAGAGTATVAVGLMLPIGLGFSLVEGAVMGVVPRLADDAVIGRVYAVSELLYAGMAAVGAAIAPLLIAWWGVGGSMAALGLVYAGLTLLTWRSCVRLDHGQQDATRARDLLHAVPFLAPLPLPQLERLVRAAEPVQVAAGTDVVVRGEIGDRFYLVGSGDLDVVEFGRTLGPGEGFGEIALLRDVRRTATIRARTDAALWTIGRAPFLAALGATPEALTVADGTVAEHLARPPIDEDPAPSGA